MASTRVLSNLLYMQCRIAPRSFLLHQLPGRSCALSYNQTEYRWSSVDSKPKKPPSSYILFCQEMRPQIIAENPDLSFTEVGKHLGEAWKRLPDHEKQSFDLRAKDLKEEYLRQKEEYMSSLSESELANLRQEEEEKRHSRARRKIKAEMKKLEKPKQPANAYAVFMSERLSGIQNPRDQMSLLSEEWKNLTEEEKMHFKEEASRLRENYNLEMEAWKERMIAEGREDVLEAKKTKGRKQKSGPKRSRAKENNDWDEEEF